LGSWFKTNGGSARAAVFIGARRGSLSRPPSIRCVANSAAAAGSTGSRATITIEISKAIPDIAALR